jgi:NAD(P)-dependent dehydrogenase (short-subunit alcohol dehydrogenase family)
LDRIDTLFRLEGRLAVVSGGGGLIGAAALDILAEAGADLVVADFNVERAQTEAARVAKNSGRRAEARGVDITDEAAVIALAEEVTATFGRPPDILLNLAAYRGASEYFTAPLGEYPLAEWEQALRVNLTGTFLMCREFGQRMYAGNGGVIVNFSSMYGLVSADPRLYGDSGINSPPPYAASKSGILNLSRYLAVHWRPKVRVNTLAPGGVEAGQTDEFLQNFEQRCPLGRMSRSDEYQGPLLFFCSDASSYMTGSLLTVDGGWTAW